MSRPNTDQQTRHRPGGLLGRPGVAGRGPAGLNEPGKTDRSVALANTTRPRVFELLIELFPVVYAAGFSRLPDDAFQRGESSVRIWFGNSFDNARGGGNPHGAIDIFGPLASPIRLTSPQTVVNEWLYDGVARAGVGTVEEGTRGGNNVRAIDSNGFIHYYAHLRAPPRLSLGKTYRAGHVIGELGDTGAARGDGHLHYQVKAPRVLTSESRYGMPSHWTDVPAFSTRGGRNVNVYDQLVVLSRRTVNPPAVQIRRGSQFVFPIRGDDPAELTGRGRLWRSVDRSSHRQRRTHRHTEP